MYNKVFVSPPKSFSRSFTLIELIIVIIIVGILASVGISQYSKMVEKGRSSEAKVIFGQLRKLAYEYYLNNGTLTGISNADLGIGTAADQIPSACRSTHYFYYVKGAASGALTEMWAYRCTSGGKTPNGSLPQTVLEFQAGMDGSSPVLFCAQCGSYPWGSCTCGQW